MSLNKSATRRFSLLAGSSLVVASLAAFTGIALAPGAAYAYDECTPTGATLGDGPGGVSDPSLNGVTADTFTCTGATAYQTTGITYSSAGNLTVSSSGSMDVGAVGINLTGATTNNVTFSGGSNSTLTGTSGAVVDVTSATGNIAVTTAGVNGTAAGVTHAVRLESTGAGNITYAKTGTNAAGRITSNAEGGVAAVSAVTNGGNIVMTIASGNIVAGTPGAVIGNGINGRLRGILAQTSGAGSVTLSVSGGDGVRASNDDGIAAVDIIAGTGGVTINLTGTLYGGAGHAVRAVSAGTTTVNNTAGIVNGSVDFSGAANGVAFTNSGTGVWRAAGDSVFSNQNDTVVLGGTNSHRFDTGSTMDFGGGVDSITMSAVLAAHGTTITNLETFNSSGAIYMGDNQTVANVTMTDAIADDILALPGTVFTGSGASRIYMDVVLGGVQQVGCQATTGAADCLYLPNGTTAGSTVVTIEDVSDDALLSGYVPDGIAFIDVAGGTTQASHFTIDLSDQGGYVHPLYGPAFDRPGHFVYVYRYDQANQRHVLVSQPRDGSLFAYAVLPAVAQSIWQLTADTVTDRQTDLRKGGDNTVWVRASGEYVKREVSTPFAGWDGPVAFDSGYKLYAGTVMAGRDFFVGQVGGHDYVLGAQIGYVSSSLDMKATESSGRMTGATGGVYAGLWSDWFFFDGTVNLNGLALDYEAPALGSRTTTFINSVGAQAEAGLRAPLTEGLFAEPLATLSYVRSSFEEISLSGATIRPEDGKSIRGALGLRVGGTLSGERASATYFVTGRAWNEFEGEAGGIAANPGVDLPFTDDFSGAFGEAEMGVNVFNAANTLSGFATTGVKWKDGYSAVNLSLGMRMVW